MKRSVLLGRGWFAIAVCSSVAACGGWAASEDGAGGGSTTDGASGGVGAMPVGGAEGGGAEGEGGAGGTGGAECTEPLDEQQLTVCRELLEEPHGRCDSISAFRECIRLLELRECTAEVDAWIICGGPLNCGGKGPARCPDERAAMTECLGTPPLSPYIAYSEDSPHCMQPSEPHLVTVSRESQLSVFAALAELDLA